MASIEDRVVQMAFKGAAFLSGVAAAVKAIDSLKKSLASLTGAGKEFQELSNDSKKVNLDGLSDSADKAAHHLDLMKIAGLTVFTTLVHQAFIAGEQILKGLTIDPIKAGLAVYETKINAIQTILANTAAEGTNLKQVTDALNQLNVYANKTVFNFGEMAKNIGTFTAAGVGLKDSVESIKGIANLAALSGSSAEQASTAMYQLSQAIANGKLTLEDWNSVVNAGLGGKVFQKALIDTARVHGVAVDEMIKKDGSFRNSLQEGWITSSILTDTLAQFTGDLSEAQLKAMGFTDAEAAAIFKQGQTAVGAATHIKTVTQLMQALSEEVATAWSRVWEAVIGNITDATTVLTKIHTVAENALTGPINHVADLLEEVDKLGGRTKAIQAFTNVFKFLGDVLRPIKEAFRDVFPPATAFGITVLIDKIEAFTEKLKVSAKTSEELKTVFTGVFSVFKIAIDVIGALFGGLGKLVGATGQAGGGFLALLATLASFVTKIKDAIESGGLLTKFFQTLGSILALPIKALGAIVGALGGVAGATTKVVSAVGPIVKKIGDEFAKLADAIGEGIKSGNFQNVINLLNGLLLGGVLNSIRKFISNLGKGGGEGGGLFSSIKESFEGLTGALKAMQTNLKSGTLLKIAAAVALLSASLVALSFVNVGNLTKALTAMTVMFTQLLVAMNVVGGISGSVGIVKMGAIALALNLLATAILILTGAVVILSHFSWEQLAKGLGAVAVLLLSLVVATNLMAGSTKGLISSAIAMKAMAVAIDILAIAVGKLGKMDFSTLAKGIGSVALLLGLLTAFSNFSGDTLISTAASMLIIGAALVVISKAVATLGGLSLGSLAKGIAGIAAVMVILIVAMAGMEAALPGAAALLVASAALVVLSKALDEMGSESWGEIGKALVLLAGSLVIIAAAMILMTEALPGAAALLVVSAALAILAPVLLALGGMSWEAIAKGLLALAGVFIIIGAAGLLLTPLVPTLLLLGAAIALLGLGMLAAGAGVLLFATGLTALAVALTAGGAAVLSFVKNVLALVPAAFKAVGDGIVALAGAISRGAGAITAAFVTILTAILNAIIKVVPLATKAFETILNAFLTAIQKDAPKIITTFLNLLLMVMNKIATFYPKFVTAGLQLIVNMLNGIAKQVPKIVQAGVNIVTAFIKAVGSGALQVVKAAANMIINFINGLANEIRKDTPRMNAAVRNLASAIISGLTSGITSGISSVINAIVNVAKSALDAAKHFLGINSPSKKFIEVGASTSEGFALGAVQSVGLVTDAMETVGQAGVDTLTKTMSDLGDALNTNLDLQPKITPVLDLDQAKAGFTELSKISKDQLIRASASSSSAAAISAANQTAATQASIAAQAGASVAFTQNNYSPTALNAGEIYRKTRNQLSIAKEALAGANAS